MLKITIPATECYDEATGLFVNTKEQTLVLEHSLVSISKWESKWHKAYLGPGERTEEEALDYIRCMTITQNVDPSTYTLLTKDHITDIYNYTNDRMTATTIKDKGKRSRDIATSEVIYNWMISLQIPFECEKWHLNRLLTLIRVCNISNGPEKKMSRKETMNRHKALNAERRKRYGVT